GRLAHGPPAGEHLAGELSAQPSLIRGCRSCSLRGTGCPGRRAAALPPAPRSATRLSDPSPTPTGGRGPRAGGDRSTSAPLVVGQERLEVRDRQSPDPALEQLAQAWRRRSGTLSPWNSAAGNCLPNCWPDTSIRLVASAGSRPPARHSTPCCDD